MRIAAPFVLAAAFLSLGTGCEELDQLLMQARAGVHDTDSSFDPTLGCEHINGTFVADALVVSSELDPAVGEDYGDYPDYVLVFDRRAKTFEAMLVRGDDAVVTSGSYSIIGDRIVFADPLLEGMVPEVALLCDYNGLDLTLHGAVGFDFTADTVDGPVDADFVGAFVHDER